MSPETTEEREEREAEQFKAHRSFPEKVRGFFPQNSAECVGWEPRILRQTLSSRVMVVAVPRIEGAWSAYCDAVPGQNHDNEWQAVKSNGSKLLEEWARPMFPIFAGVPYAR